MRRTFALISVLVLISAGLVIFALQSQPSKKPVAQPKPITAKPTPVADTVLSLSPNPVQISASGSGTIEVMIDSGYNTVSGVQLELAYDPKILMSLKITPGPFLKTPIVLLNQDDKETGRYSYAMGISPSQQPGQGNGIVAYLTFKRAPGAIGTETTVSLLDKSLVTMLGIQGSVLKKTSHTSISLFPVRGTNVVLPTQGSVVPSVTNIPITQ